MSSSQGTARSPQALCGQAGPSSYVIPSVSSHHAFPGAAYGFSACGHPPLPRIARLRTFGEHAIAHRMTAHLLDRRHHAARPALPVLGDMALPLARLHEGCGPARHSLAMLVAAATRGPVFWIAPRWQAEAPNPDGMAAFAAPARFTFVAPERAGDLLWTLEEVLRSGAVPLAVADLP